MMKILAVETKLQLREWPGIAFTAGLPLALLLVLGSMPGFSEIKPELGGQSLNDTQMPAMMTMLALLTLAFTVLPTTLTAYRERGVLRRMSTTPVHPARVLAAQLVINLAIAALSTLLLIVCARLVLGTVPPRAPVAFALVYLLGTAALLAMGLVVAAILTNSKVAAPVGSVIMFPLMFVAGMWIPRELMSPVLRTIGDFSVAGPFAQALRDTWAGNAPQLPHLAVMAGGLLVFGGLAVRLFRWE
ncbi:ABC transporter permease [Nonomuraea endophytica]|uniref:Transport permease protein n=1 Tax=Nonomuraea endophytica TaxID=714136 RepID=A0A7W7ZYA6_9ACTN|nr:ABC transporter permease [Nonomuraea endophytica]MBB5076048.1 ABC-2 type transport system permease protein [Nonomuraea endophytica]